MHRLIASGSDFEAVPEDVYAVRFDRLIAQSIRSARFATRFDRYSMCVAIEIIPWHRYTRTVLYTWGVTGLVNVMALLANIKFQPTLARSP